MWAQGYLYLGATLWVKKSEQIAHFLKIRPWRLFMPSGSTFKENRSEQILSIAQNDAQEENQGRRLNMLATTGCNALKCSLMMQCLSWWLLEAYFAHKIKRIKV